MNLEKNGDQLILNVLGPADEDIEYFSLLPFWVKVWYLPKGAPWDAVVSTTLQLLKELLDNEWIIVEGYNNDWAPSPEEGADVLYNWVRAGWEKIDFRSPLDGEVMYYELSPKARTYYRANRERRIYPEAR